MINEAIRLATLGYLIFPLLPKCKIPPAGGAGCYDGTADVAKVRQWWENVPARNIGVHCADIVVIDVDQHDKSKPESRRPNEWLNDYPERQSQLESAPHSVTATGGRHYFFKQPAGLEVKGSIGHVGLNIDCKSRGGYIIAPPSRTADGSYEWLRPIECAPCDLPELPDWLLGLIRGPKWNHNALDRGNGFRAVDCQTVSGLSGELERRAAAYLDKMPPAIEGQNGSGATYAAAVALTHGFGIQPARALALLELVYNPRCVPAWSTKELTHKVDDAASKSHDMPYLWLRNDAKSSAVDLSGILTGGGEAAEIDPNTPTDPGPFPVHLLGRPGFIDDVIAYNLAGAYKPQPLLAMAGAFCLLGMLAGRKVRDCFNTRTNLYCLGVAPSTSGKERARQVNSNICAYAGSPGLVANGIGSYQGLFAALSTTPSMLLQIDEIGRFFKSLNAATEKHQTGQVDALMSLFTSSTTTVSSDLIVDRSKVLTINQPNLCLYGTTTPAQLYQSLNQQNIEEGFFGRTLVFETVDVDEIDDLDSPESPPASVVEAARYWLELQQTGNLMTENPRPAVIAHTAAAKGLLKAVRREVAAHKGSSVELYAALWGRAVEKINKLALLSAVSRDWASATIEESDIAWAAELIEYLTKQMAYIAHKWVAGSAYDSQVKTVLRIVGNKPDGATLTDIGNRSNLPAKIRKEVLADLLERGLVIAQEVETRGRPATRYVLNGRPAA